MIFFYGLWVYDLRLDFYSQALTGFGHDIFDKINVRFTAIIKLDDISSIVKVIYHILFRKQVYGIND